jgi:hypothetical protein
MEGSSIYRKLKYSDKPFFCRILDNLNTGLPFNLNHDEDPVYCALKNLYGRIEEIFKEQFVPFISYKKDKEKDENLEEAENVGKYWQELESKRSFIDGLLDYFINRGPSSNNGWGKDVCITPIRYELLLEELVNSSPEEKKYFENEFIAKIPAYSYEGFHFWPEE